MGFKPGEGFAFAAWARGMAVTHNWTAGEHGWQCLYCRMHWDTIKRCLNR